MQIPAIYWSYKTASHAAELTVVNAAWDKGLLIGGENVITCFARECCTNKPSRYSCKMRGLTIGRPCPNRQI
ncbi:unnamed protein product [Brassica oleracea]